MLSVFDQTQKDGHNRQVLRIDETQYDDDADMQRIVQRLLMAASDSQLRQDMNVEDEYFSAIETRDTAIMNRDAKIKKLDAELEEKNSQLEEKNSQLEEKNSQLLKANDIPLWSSISFFRRDFFVRSGTSFLKLRG